MGTEVRTGAPVVAPAPSTAPPPPETVATPPRPGEPARVVSPEGSGGRPPARFGTPPPTAPGGSLTPPSVTRAAPTAPPMSGGMSEALAAMRSGGIRITTHAVVGDVGTVRTITPEQVTTAMAGVTTRAAFTTAVEGLLRTAGVPEAQLTEMMASLSRVIDLRNPTRTPGEPYAMSYTPTPGLRDHFGGAREPSGATVVPAPAPLRRIDI